MKTLLLLIISCLLLLATPPPRETIPFSGAVATCYGNSPCKACSNCSRCGHCSRGGSCGICAKPQTKTANTLSAGKTTTKNTSVYIGQCKALTKKGARCKRNGDGSGYCWQHGK